MTNNLKDTIREGLPHKYLHKKYPWQVEFLNSKNKKCIVCGGNQIHKSTTLMQKAIYYATETELWDQLWNIDYVGKPNLFWYLYPSQDVINTEFKTKWIKYLPKGVFKDDPKYGWQEVKDGKDTAGVIFNSGIYLDFKKYLQRTMVIQASSVYAIFADEEIPVEHVGELESRLSATDGYWNGVFTFTLGQQFWWQVMHGKGALEKWKGAFKRVVSLWDCQYFSDGSASKWTDDAIIEKMNAYPTISEAQRRIDGLLIKDEGLVYESFNEHDNIVPVQKIPDGYMIYAGCDYGTGGKNHASTISFIAVSPSYDHYIWFKAWTGKGIITDPKIVIDKYKEMAAELKAKGKEVIACYYDYAAADLGRAAESEQLPFLKADKSHTKGEGIMNSLFRIKKLDLQAIPELELLVLELNTLSKNTPKHRAKDDLIDSLRYALSSLPIRFDVVQGKKLEYKNTGRMTLKESNKNRKPITNYTDYEIEEWNSYMEGYDEF